MSTPKATIERAERMLSAAMAYLESNPGANGAAVGRHLGVSRVAGQKHRMRALAVLNAKRREQERETRGRPAALPQCTFSYDIPIFRKLK